MNHADLPPDFLTATYTIDDDGAIAPFSVRAAPRHGVLQLAIAGRVYQINTAGQDALRAALSDINEHWDGHDCAAREH